MVLTVKLLTSHRKMSKFKSYYEKVIAKKGNELKDYQISW
jgi:hypothetical protein